MLSNFKINSNEIDKVGNFSKSEKDFRLRNLDYFNKVGLPNKKIEDWKFTDLREIFSKNFKSVNFNKINTSEKNINFITDFEHNYIVSINGELNESSFKFEDKSKIKIKNFFNDDFSDIKVDNPLINLNHALSNKGYSLDIEDNYKFQKVLVIYNIFTNDLKKNIINIKNRINIGKNAEIHTIDYTINKSKKFFFNNIVENILLDQYSVFKNICLQNEKSKGFFHKFSKFTISKNAKYISYFFPSGSKFNKTDLQFDMIGENSECKLLAASYLDEDDHQEIKTRINHLVPNCKSYQKVKNVLNSESKGVFQGKIYVKDLAQKTDAYQLSNAILLSENSEFDSKPELEIYADDVKCSHGSTSGNIDENSIFYLMSRGISKSESIKMLVSGFLSEITDLIKSDTIRSFVKKKLESQLYGYKKD